MIAAAVTTLVASIVIFSTLLLVTQLERRRGRRFFAANVRTWLDGIADSAGDSIVRGFDHFIKYIVQLNWYYSIHSVLKGILRFIVAVYTYFEDMFEQNRKRAKELRAEKRQLNELNHLRQMADHKENTTLSPAEQRRLKKRKLEHGD